MLICDALTELGYATIEAEDGPSGLRVIQSGAKVDLLITDVGLPGGLNGRQVADAARASRPDLKVLFITGYADKAAAGSALLGQGMQVMTKPFSFSALAAKIRLMLTKS
jgi:CheY-like chemotaxis protein